MLIKGYHQNKKWTLKIFYCNLNFRKMINDMNLWAECIWTQIILHEYETTQAK